MAFILYLFLFYIDYTIYAYHDFIRTKDTELIIKYRVIWIPWVLTVFSLTTFTCEVKVVQSYFIV